MSVSVAVHMRSIALVLYSVTEDEFVAWSGSIGKQHTTFIHMSVQKLITIANRFIPLFRFLVPNSISDLAGAMKKSSACTSADGTGVRRHMGL